MTKSYTNSSNFGEPLSVEAQKLVNDVRQRITQPIGSNFNSDFNIYRFVMNAERGLKHRKDIVEHAAKALNQHLRLRKCMQLDDLPDIPFEKNAIFKHRFLPCGAILDVTDCFNRLLWYIEYATISVEGIAHGMKSSEAIKYQFWQFEHMLRRVNQQEAKTGCFSSLRHIIDMNGYEINPFTMLFVSSGTLSYYSQLFHYENYPELVNPIEMVNIAKWIHVPYKLIKTMMPAGFADRFRLHDGNFLQYLTSEISADDVPTSLGGNNETIHCIPAEKLPHSEYWQASENLVPQELETLHVSAKKSKHYRIVVEKEEKQILSWYFRTDGDIYFGVFYEPHINRQSATSKEEKDSDIVDQKEMVYPWLKLGAKLFHEYDAIELSRPGVYHIIFCNRHSWLHRRTIECMVQLTDGDEVKRCMQSGELEPLDLSGAAQPHYLDGKVILAENQSKREVKSS